MIDQGPKFAAWSNENLADFAASAYKKLQEQSDVIEHLRQDNKDLQRLLRECLKGSK